MKRESIVLRIDNPTKWVWKIIHDHYSQIADDIEYTALKSDDLWDELRKGEDAAAPMTIKLSGMPIQATHLNQEWDVYEVLGAEGEV